MFGKKSRYCRWCGKTGMGFMDYQFRIDDKHTMWLCNSCYGFAFGIWATDSEGKKYPDWRSYVREIIEKEARPDIGSRRSGSKTTT